MTMFDKSTFDWLHQLANSPNPELDNEARAFMAVTFLMADEDGKFEASDEMLEQRQFLGEIIVRGFVLLQLVEQQTFDDLAPIVRCEHCRQWGPNFEVIDRIAEEHPEEAELLADINAFVQNGGG